MVILQNNIIIKILKNIKNFSKVKKYILISIIFCLVCFVSTFVFKSVQYKTYINNLKTALEKNDISSLNYSINNPPTILFMKNGLKNNNDLDNLYKNHLDDLLNKYKNNLLSEENYLANLVKLKTAVNMPKDLLNSYFNKATKYNESNKKYVDANNLLNKKDYKQAYKLFSEVLPMSDKYSDAVSKIQQCSKYIKDSVFEEVDKLISKNLFDDAENTLEKNSVYFALNDDNDKKLNEIQKKKEDYFKNLDSKPTASISATNIPNLSDINIKSINNFNIASKSKYLIYANLDEQKVYVLAGYSKSWNILKSFPCASGIPSQPTPKGVFKIGMRGDWFFADQYNEGAKYWLAFSGANYLFHSEPYDRTAENILDKTMGKPASHGCIRLETKNAYWLYSNIPDNTEVIIN